jgi:hypothetical protein
LGLALPEKKLTIHRCRVCDDMGDEAQAKSRCMAGMRNGAMYEFVCLGTHVVTMQELVTYKGVGGQDDGRFFYTTASHWRTAFEESPCPIGPNVGTGSPCAH